MHQIPSFLQKKHHIFSRSSTIPLSGPYTITNGASAPHTSFLAPRGPLPVLSS